MRDLLKTLDAWRSEGVGAGRAIVVRTFGSAPRPEGAVLLAAEDGRLMGSVSGGCVEGAAAEEIERARRTGNARVIRYGISDEEAWDVGLACGGTIDVLVQPVVPPAADAALGAGAARILDDGRSRTVEVGGRAFFVEAFPVRPRLVVVGAVEVARSLVRYAREIGYEGVVVDGRASFATPERFPDVDRLVGTWPDEGFQTLDVGPHNTL